MPNLLKGGSLLMKLLSKKIISIIIKQYGGSQVFKKNPKFLNKDVLTYTNRKNPNIILSIWTNVNMNNGKKYIQVELSDENGYMVQIDAYELLFNNTELYLISSRKNDEIQYHDKPIAYVGNKIKQK